MHPPLLGVYSKRSFKVYACQQDDSDPGDLAALHMMLSASIGRWNFSSLHGMWLTYMYVCMYVFV